MTLHEDEAWLERLKPAEWISAAVSELKRAEQALAERDFVRANAGLKRAAGMACNGALLVVPNASWGRSYVEHLKALASDDRVPAAVREAAELLCGLAPARGPIVPLTTSSQAERWLEAARTVMAHAYAIVYGSVGRPR